MKKLFSPVGRVSFPQLFEAGSYQGSAPKYSLILVFDVARFTPAEKKLWLAMQGLADEVSLEKFKKKIAQLPANFKKPIRDGAEKEDLQGFGEGTKFCTFSSKMKPGIVDRNGVPIGEDRKDEIYPGMYARVSLTAYAYDNVGKGVAFGLQNVQKIADGERLDSRTDAANDFAEAGDVEFNPPAAPADEEPDF